MASWMTRGTPSPAIEGNTARLERPAKRTVPDDFEADRVTPLAQRAHTLHQVLDALVGGENADEQHANRLVLTRVLAVRELGLRDQVSGRKVTR
jgi:hypothetical protein